MLHLHLAKMSRLGACKYFFQYLLLSLLLTYNSYNFLQFSKNSEKSNCRFWEQGVGGLRPNFGYHVPFWDQLGVL